MANAFAGKGRSGAETLAMTFGVIFIVAGILGFIPNPLVSEGGLFEVNAFHNMVHIVTGGILLASPYYGASVIAMRVLGVVYAIVTVLGFVSLDALTSLGMAANHLDNWLHLLVAGALLWAGFALPVEDRPTTAHM